MYPRRTWRARFDVPRAHREHEKRTGRSHLLHRSAPDTDWPAWYAAYMAAEQAEADLPS